MARILPVVIALLGLGIGTGVGFFLRPQSATENQAGAPAGEITDGGEVRHGESTASGDEASVQGDGAEEDVENDSPEYVKLNNQFVIPVIKDKRVAALVVLSLSLEVGPGGAAAVYSREPRLRDSFLQVLFEHANAGGFSGNFTRSSNMDALRRALLEAAHKTMGNSVTDILVIDILRQDS